MTEFAVTAEATPVVRTAQLAVTLSNAVVFVTVEFAATAGATHAARPGLLAVTLSNAATSATTGFVTKPTCR